MTGIGLTWVPPLTRRRFLQLAGASAATLVLTQAIPRQAEAATWRLHDDTDTVGLHQLYSGSDNPPGCDIGEAADCRGPGRMSCYWGALYVNSVSEHRLRTGPFTGSCNATWPGTGNTERVRWASHRSASVWTPEYRFIGKLYVYDIMARPDPWTGLVLHPMHVDNCNNYWIRVWERDEPDHVVWGKEVEDRESWITEASVPKTPKNPDGPLQEEWHDYRVDVLPGSRLKFYWDGALIFDATDPEHSFSGGPVGMRLDYFDTILDETRVYQP
jgi:hypothetical protein